MGSKNRLRQMELKNLNIKLLWKQKRLQRLIKALEYSDKNPRKKYDLSLVYKLRNLLREACREMKITASEYYNMLFKHAAKQIVDNLIYECREDVDKMLWRREEDPWVIEALIDALMYIDPEARTEALRFLIMITKEDFGLDQRRWWEWWGKNKKRFQKTYATRFTPRWSLRYVGNGLTWIIQDSLLGKIFPTSKSDFLRSILNKTDLAENITNFSISELRHPYLPFYSVNAICVSSEPFDTYFIFSPTNNHLLWCEIHVHGLRSPKVLLRDRIEDAQCCPANYYLIEPLLKLHLCAVSPPQSDYFTATRNDYGIAVIATSIQPYCNSWFLSKLCRKEKGALFMADSKGKRRYLDEVVFRGEIIDLDTLNSHGIPVSLIQCKLDFGDKGELILPIYASQNSIKLLRKGEYVSGIGSLQLFQVQ